MLVLPWKHLYDMVYQSSFMVQNIREESVPVLERLNFKILQIKAIGQ